MWNTVQTRRPDPAPSQDQQGQKRAGHSRKLYVGAHVLPHAAPSPKSVFPSAFRPVSPATATYEVTVQNLRPDYLIFRLMSNGQQVAEVDYCDQRKLICNFQTNPRQRGQGWGRIMLQTALEHPLVKKNVIVLNAKPYGNLNSALAQSRLEEFYRSFGFEATGRISLKGTEMRLSPFRRRLHAFVTAMMA